LNYLLILLSSRHHVSSFTHSLIDSKIYTVLPTEKEIQRNMKQKEGGNPTELLSSIASNSKKDVTENFSLFQREAFKKMKSITDASDDVCVTLLSKTGFKLNDSIELFYRGER
jgi:hypothetical protein